MADLTYQVLVETQRAQQNLKNLQNGVGQVNSTLNGLKSALAGIAIGAFIQNAIRSTVALKNMSDATGIAIQSIDGFAQAMSAAGGTADRALDGISDLTKNIGAAAQGSAELQKSFADVGISLEDLATLDEGQILRQTIAGLAEMPDSGTRTARAMQLLGESVKGVNLQQLNRDLDGYIDRSRISASAIDSIQRSQAALGAATRTLQNSVVRAITPIADAINRLSTEQLDAIVDAFVKIGGAAVAFVALSKTLSVLSGALTFLGGAAAFAWAAFKTGLAGVAAGLVASSAKALTSINIFKQLAQLWSTGLFGGIGFFSKLSTTISALPVAVAKLGPALVPFLVPLLKLGGIIAGIMGAFWLLNEAVKAVFGVDVIDTFISGISRAYNAVKEFLGLGPVAVKFDADDQSAAETRRLNSYAQQIEKRKVINQLLEDEKKKVREALTEYQQQNAEFARSFDLQTRRLNLTEEQLVVEEAMADTQQRYLDAVNPLLARMNELRASGNANELAALPALEAGIQRITQEYEAQLPALQVLISARLDQMSIQKEQLRLEEQLQAAADRRAATEESVRNIILEGQKKIRSGYEELELSGLSGVERALRQIAIEERNVAEAARERVAAQFGDNDPAGLVRAMEDINRASQEVVRQRQAATRAVMEEQRSFASGWRNAWAEYADNAANASRYAADVFRTATKGMEDALVGFVKTGKFEWRGFVSDILEQLLRAQIQQGIASLGASLGLGNLFGTPGGGGGAAANTRGATPTSPLFVQDVAGSSGITGGLNAQQAAMTQQTQSIFSRMGEVMSTIGSYLGGAMKSISGVISSLVGSLSGIMGSIMKGMGSALSGIGSMIMSLVRSIVSMFGGYFADGGVLPRGQFGIVGERGPEIITGPATVTPMSGIGGGTQVIYNINAVDARSFQQLLAQDPGLIFALTEQGRKSLAGSRR